MASILGWLDSQNVGRLGGKPIWYGASLLDASQAMLTPSTERTEERLEAGPNSPDHTGRGTVSGTWDQRVVEEDKASVTRIGRHLLP